MVLCFQGRSIIVPLHLGVICAFLLFNCYLLGVLITTYYNCDCHIHSVPEHPVMIVLDEGQHQAPNDWHMTARFCQLIHSGKLRGVSIVVATRPLSDIKYKPKFIPVPPGIECFDN